MKKLLKIVCIVILYSLSNTTYSQNIIIDGTTAFIEKRAKQELQYMFYDKITDALNKEYKIKILDKEKTIKINLKEVFKNTLNLIKNTDVFNSNAFGNEMWNDAFKSDLDSIYNYFEPIANSICNEQCRKQKENYVSSKIQSSDQLSIKILKTVNLLSAVANYDELSQVIKTISFLGTFMIDMIKVGKEDSILTTEIVLNKYTAPVGSYRYKQKSRWSLDINTYPGISYGYEGNDSQSSVFQITAPIGFNFSKKNNHQKEFSSSSSVFLSIFDLGAPLSYRVKNDDIEEGFPQEIKWEQLISPGLFYVYGFRKTPIVLTTGFQYMPKLRGIGDLQKNVFRVSAGLQVDVTLFNLIKKDDTQSRKLRGEKRYEEVTEKNTDIFRLEYILEKRKKLKKLEKEYKKASRHKKLEKKIENLKIKIENLKRKSTDSINEKEIKKIKYELKIEKLKIKIEKCKVKEKKALKEIKKLKGELSKEVLIKTSKEEFIKSNKKIKKLEKLF